MRLNMGTQARNAPIPGLCHVSFVKIGVRLKVFDTYTMEVVCQDVEKVDIRLDSLGVDVLQVLVLCWHNRRKTSRAKSFTKLLHKVDLVGLVDSRVTATSLSTRPLPVNVDTLKIPLIEELKE
jgi:hypothetical protein